MARDDDDDWGDPDEDTDDKDTDDEDDWTNDDDGWDGVETFDYDEWVELYEDDYFEDAEYEEVDGGIDYEG